MRTTHRLAPTTAKLAFLLLMAAGICPAQEAPPKPSFTGKSGRLTTNPGPIVLSAKLTVTQGIKLVNEMTTKPLVIWVETGPKTAKETSIRIPVDDVKSFTANALSGAGQARIIGTLAFSRIPFALARKKSPNLKDALEMMNVKQGESGFLDAYIDTEGATCLLVKSSKQEKFLEVE